MVAGVDCSTQATKVLVVDPDDGRVVASGRAPHEVTGTGGARETDPEVWWDALRRGAGRDRPGGRGGRDLGRRPAARAGGHRRRTGAALRPAVLWNDTRSAPEAAELRDALGADAWAERWAWCRCPRSRSRAGRGCARTSPRWRRPRARSGSRTTGSPSASAAAASPTAATPPGRGGGRRATRTTATRCSSWLELDRALLPEVLGPSWRGPSRPADLGLPAGALVGPGTGDNMGAALGLGLRPGEPVVSLGTSGTAYAAMTERASTRAA